METKFVLFIVIILLAILVWTSSRDPLTVLRAGGGVVAAQGKVHFGPDQVMLFDHNEPALSCGGRNRHRKKADDMKIRRPFAYAKYSRGAIPDMEFIQEEQDRLNYDEVADITNTLRPAYSATEPSHEPLEA